MANTHPAKILVPNGQIDIIVSWADQGLFSSVTAFCTSAVEKQIEAQIRLQAKLPSRCRKRKRLRADRLRDRPFLGELALIYIGKSERRSTWHLKYKSRDKMAEETHEQQKELKFKYKFPDDYAPTYANGAVGGINCKGEVMVNFFTERYPIPKSETFELGKDGQVGRRLAVDPTEMPVIRTVSGGVIMSRESAEEIYLWLGRVLGKQQ